MTEGEVIREGDHALVLQLLRCVVGERVHTLRRGRGGADEVRIGPALGHVLRGGEAQDRHLRGSGIVGDGEQLEGREGAEDHVDVVALGQLLGLGLGARGIAAGVGDHELDLAAGQRVVPVLEEADGALLHLDAALGERPRLHGQETDADRLGLRPRGPGQGGGGRERGTRQERAPIELGRHWLPPGAFSTLPILVERPRASQSPRTSALPPARREADSRADPLRPAPPRRIARCRWASPWAPSRVGP